MEPIRAGIKLTYAEYRTLPETGPRYQLLEGQLVMTPAPSFRHQTVVARLFAALFNFAEPRRLGVVRAAPLDVILGAETVLQPDIVYLSNTRRGLIAEEGVRGAPDLCVEVLSPHSREFDLGAKRALYAQHGVLEYWAVDPDANTVEVDRLQQAGVAPGRSFGASDSVSTLLLPGLSILLRDVFAP